MKATVSQHEQRILADAQTAVLQHVGLAGYLHRCREIEALPSKEWRGKRGDRPPVTLYRLTCRADFGRGKHERWLPESVLWSLLSLDEFRCEYHR